MMIDRNGMRVKLKDVYKLLGSHKGKVLKRRFVRNIKNEWCK